MSNQQLGKLASSWWNKTVKKLKPPLVNDVHSVVVREPSEGNLELLLRFDYFDNVLWKFFDRDVTTNYIELMVVMLLYDREKDQRLAYVYEDVKFKLLIERCLYITFEMTSASNYRLHRMIIQLFEGLKEWNLFYGVLVEGVGDLGPDHLLKNWLSNLIKKSVTLLYEVDTADFVTYLQAVILFTKSLQDQHPSLEVPFEYFNPVVELKQHLKLVCSATNYYSAFLRQNYKKWTLKPTTYDLTNEDLGFLDNMSENELKEILVSLGVKVYEGYTVRSYKQCVKHYLTESNIDDNITFFDTFDKVPEFDFELPLTDDYSYRVYKHVVQVLDRVNIQLDNKGNLKLAGKSKYFSRTDDSKEDNNVLLLKIDKPNKFSTIARVKKYGIEEVKYTLRMVEGFNYYIKFPQISKKNINVKYRSEPLQLDSLIFDGYNGFLDYKHNKKTNVVSIAKINHNDEFVEIKDSSKLNYTTQQSKAIFSALTSRVSLIDVAPHGGSIKILNGILENLVLNSSTERTLVVFPFKTWKSFQIPEEISSCSVKFDEDIDSVRMVDDILQFTSSIADRIGEDGLFFAATVTNALIFYKTVVPEVRNKYLEEVKTKEYPFASVSEPDEILAFEQRISRAEDSLSTLSTLMKFPRNQAKVREFLINCYFLFVFTSADSMQNIVAPFDNIIAFESQHIHTFKALNYKRLIVMGDSTEASGTSLYTKAEASAVKCPITTMSTSKELFDIYQHGNLDPIQLFSPVSNLTVLKNSDNVNIEEAETCVKLYHQLESTDACIVASSPYQHALLQEMKANSEPVDEVTIHKTIILSLHGYRTYGDIVRCAKRCQKLYIIGDVKEPNTFAKGVQYKKSGKVVKFH